MRKGETWRRERDWDRDGAVGNGQRRCRRRQTARTWSKAGIYENEQCKRLVAFVTLGRPFHHVTGAGGFLSQSPLNNTTISMQRWGKLHTARFRWVSLQSTGCTRFLPRLLVWNWQVEGVWILLLILIMMIFDELLCLIFFFLLLFTHPGKGNILLHMHAFVQQQLTHFHTSHLPSITI